MDGFNLGSIVAHIKAETSQFTAGLEDAKAQASGFASKMTTVAAGAAAVVDAIVIGFGVKSVKAFEEAQVVTAQLEQVLKTTGKSSSVTADQVQALAMNLEEYSAQSHVAIEQGQTILLQFAGITKDTLPAASKAMVDLAQRMGVDTVTAAKQLGIALDNPDQGMARLKRSGIDFTASQVEAIKSLQKSGDTAGAAALLMQVLETKVGGAGGAYRKTLAGGVEEAKLKLKDFEEGVGKKIITWLNDAYTWYLKNQRVVNDFAGVIGTLVGVLAVALVLYGNWILLTKGLAIAQAALNLIMDMNPIVLAIMAIVVVAVLLLEHWKTVKQWFDDFMQWFKTHWEDLLLVFGPLGLIVMEIIKHWSDLKQWFMDFIHDVGGFFTQLWHDINGIWQGMVKDAENILEAVYTWFKNLPGNILNAIGNVGKLLFDVGKNIIQGLIDGITNMGKVVEDKVKAVANGIKDVAKKILGVFSPSTVFHDIGMNVGQGLVNGMNAMQDSVTQASTNMAVSAVAPAAAIVNNASNSSNSTINTNISGPINIASNVDANGFLQRLTTNQELAMKGLTPVK